jgi:hypothetical protein
MKAHLVMEVSLIPPALTALLLLLLHLLVLRLAATLGRLWFGLWLGPHLVIEGVFDAVGEGHQGSCHQGHRQRQAAGYPQDCV